METEALKQRLAQHSHLGPKLTEAQRIGLVRNYLSKEAPTMSALAEQYGVTPQTIRYHLRKHLK